MFLRETEGDEALGQFVSDDAIQQEELVDAFERLFERDGIEQVADDYRLPEGVRVVAHGYKSGRDFSWVQTPSWQCVTTIEIPNADMDALRHRGYKIALKLGGLYVMIYYNPLPHTREALYWGRHFPLYPRWSHPVTWIQNAGPWPSKEMVRFYFFAHMLGIAWGADDPGSQFAAPSGLHIAGPMELVDFDGNPYEIPSE